MRVDYWDWQDEIQGMDLLAFGSDSTQELPELGNVYWILLDDNDEVAGYCSVRPLRSSSLDGEWAETAFLSRATVLPHARGQAMQRRMIDIRVKWARANDFQRVVTTVNWFNTASLRNLVKRGFVPYVPKWDWTEGDGVVFLEKIL